MSGHLGTIPVRVKKGASDWAAGDIQPEVW
jgi:hypothetical protein